MRTFDESIAGYHKKLLPSTAESIYQ